jgi:protease-4
VARAGRWLVAAGLIALGWATAEAALPDYARESRALIDAPGVSGSLAAAFFNPAAPVAQGQRGFLLSVDDPAGRDWDGTGWNRRPWAALFSQRYLTLGARRLWPAGPDGARVDEVTLGVAGGDRGRALGLAYVWNREPAGDAVRDRHLLAGGIRRWRFLSLGLSGALDLERDDNHVQADVGVRPWGPRLTLFADAVYGHGQRFEDIAAGYGLDLVAAPGVRLAAKAQTDGSVGFSITLGLAGRVRPSARVRFDDRDGRAATAFALESGAWQPPAGYGLIGRGSEYRRMSLQGTFGYQRYRLFDRRRTLLGTLATINACADDPRAGGLVVNLSGARMDGEIAWELRAQLAGLRARGRKVILYADRLGMYGTMLASVADQVWLDPQGSLSLRGLAIGRTYYANALAKAGVGFDELRFFTYKSAAEIGARTSMSPADREQRQALVDEAYETVARLVTEGRAIDRASWNRLVDERSDVTPAEARAAGLIDSIGTFEQACRAARTAERRPGSGAEVGAGAGDAAGTGAQAAPAALAGVLGEPARVALEWGEPPRIAVLYAVGDCAMESGIRGPVLAAAVERARKDRRVKAIVLRVDSPGGERLPSDLVAREMRAAAKVKPVIVSQGSVAASGGYYLSMEANTIVTCPLTRTGSIGVISAHAWDNGLGDKLGFAYDGVQRGAHADYLSGWGLPFYPTPLPHRRLTAEERRRAESLIRTMYAEFVAHVAQARGKPEGGIEAIAQGRVWSGTRALDLGLADVEGGLWEALRLAKARAGLPADRPVALPQGPAPGWIDPARLRLAGLPGLEERAFVESLLRSAGRPLMLAEPCEPVEAR